MSLKKQAEQFAKKITGVNPIYDGGCLNYEGKLKNGRSITLQYRQRWNDWVCWVGDQLEGTLLGDHEHFLKLPS
jgi:hypothetical protein